MMPDSLLENKRWGDHYKYWHNYFNKSKDIVDDIIKISQDVDTSLLTSYYVELSPTHWIQHSNPLAFALVTCNQVDTIIKKAKDDDEFSFTFYSMIFTTFIESAYFVKKNDAKWMVNPTLFEFYKEYIDWFGLFFYIFSNNIDAYEFEKGLFQKYYEDIFNIDEGRPAESGSFWRAVKLGVQMPITYIYNSLLEQSTSFAIDEHDLFYKPILRYWDSNELDDFLKIEIVPDSISNVIAFMEQLRQHKESRVLITLR